MGRSEGFVLALWAMAQHLGHSAKPITIAQKYTTVFYKLAISFKGTVVL
jgi:hypothetical protein